ncbi:endonuclease MutS2 [Paenibacillus sp. GYB003]|uniref:endonuclease MutS2 n=1 Tax=Paenibacillus sp. GYB003 TaxID=2994392 RepID=UPI003FA6D1D9
MNETTWNRLDYGRIKAAVAEYAVSYLGKQQVERLAPMATVKAVRAALDETAEALAVLNTGASVPIPSLTGIETVLQLTGTGYVFAEHDFANIRLFLQGCAQLKAYMAAKAHVAPHIASYAGSMHALAGLAQEIDRCIRNGQVADGASRELHKVRRKLAANAEKIKSRMDALMSKYRTIMQEQLYSVRSDRYVLPIKKEHRKLVSGTVLDESSSGQTVYIEPTEIAHLQHESAALRAEEATEEAKVLAMLTGLVEEADFELRVNVETIGTYDFIFAKAKYALATGARNVGINDRGRIRLRKASHPLLGPGTVPLDFTIGETFSSLIITGPNTGGKTITLKTVGLLTLMAGSGLLVPAGEGSELSVFANVAADIGDGQSIEQSLSTFSAHIRNMVDILKTADRSTLVLLDELASGTDPGEGVGLSIAILEALHERGATVVATTHFNEIKHFAANASGFENARMEFDAETLQPLYRLRIGEAGQSYALLIATKLGISPDIIERSRQLTSRRSVRADPDAETAIRADGAEEAAHTAVHAIHANTAEAAGPGTDESGEQDSRAEAAEDGRERQAAIPERQEGEKPEKEPEQTARDGETADVRPTERRKRFEPGDCVYIAHMGITGIVYAPEDGRGMVGVMVRKQKCKINHKRLALHIPKQELYPENYDFDIVFETKKDRKLKKQMSKRHVQGAQIVKKPD